MNAVVLFFKNWKNILWLGLSLIALYIIWAFKSTIMAWLTPSDKKKRDSVLAEYPADLRPAMSRYSLRFANALGTNKDASFWNSWFEDDAEIPVIVKDMIADNLDFDGIALVYQKTHTDNRSLSTDIQTLTDEPYLTKTNKLFASINQRAMAGIKKTQAQKIRQEKMVEPVASKIVESIAATAAMEA